VRFSLMARLVSDVAAIVDLGGMAVSLLERPLLRSYFAKTAPSRPRPSEADDGSRLGGAGAEVEGGFVVES
jgi:hypothetical protein